MTRLWQPAIPIRVLAVDGYPAHCTWDGRRFRVEHMALRWRVRIWWRGIWREYYKLVVYDDVSVALVVIYYDLLDYGWYLQEMYD